MRDFFRAWCLIPAFLAGIPVLPYLGLWLGANVDGLGLICALALSIYYVPVVMIVSPWMPLFFESGNLGYSPTVAGHIMTVIFYLAVGFFISWLNTLEGRLRRYLWPERKPGPPQT